MSFRCKQSFVCSSIGLIQNYAEIQVKIKSLTVIGVFVMGYVEGLLSAVEY